MPLLIRVVGEIGYWLWFEVFSAWNFKAWELSLIGASDAKSFSVSYHVSAKILPFLARFTPLSFCFQHRFLSSSSKLTSVCEKAVCPSYEIHEIHLRHHHRKIPFLRSRHETSSTPRGLKSRIGTTALQKCSLIHTKLLSMMPWTWGGQKTVISVVLY